MNKTTTKTGQILVVGGYGSVGRIICTDLGNRFPGQVVAAGRNYRKASEFSSETEGNVLPQVIDIFGDHGWNEVLSDVTVVVMCIDQRDTNFIEECTRRGIHYVDITATYEFLAKIEALDTEARKHGATIVLSVGLAPGLTNLLAAHCKSELDEIRNAEIFIMLGLGEVHGEASNRWVIEKMNAKYIVTQAGGDKHVSGFQSGKKTLFPDDIGRRTAFRFNFSDQHTISKTLAIPSASTWLCFDSPLMTYLFAFYRKVGLFGLLRFRSIREGLVRILNTFHFGSDRFAIKVDAMGVVHQRQASYDCSILGRGEGRTTGLVAAEVAQRLYSASFTPGVFHIEQLFDPVEFIEATLHETTFGKGSITFIEDD